MTQYRIGLREGRYQANKGLPAFMDASYLTRRVALMLAFALAACGQQEDEQVYQPLRYNYLPPIQLNVAVIQIEQRFVPTGVPPDVSTLDPVPPAEALRAMATDRLQTFGTANKAVFAILDASLSRQSDVVIGSMAVSLTIFDDSGAQLGFAQARVQSRHTGRLDHIRSVLYDMTNSMMSDMNVEFEYQVRHSLKNWLTTDVVPETPVEQTPLDQSPSPNGPAPRNGPSPDGGLSPPSGSAPATESPPQSRPVPMTDQPDQ